MKLLQITPQAPSRFGGGGIGVEQTVLSIKGNEDSENQVDYIGPEIKDKAIEKLYNNVNYLAPNRNIFTRAIDTLCGNTNARYRAWKKWAKQNDLRKYDAIIMDFTKLPYCLPYINGIPLYVRVHNIEYDYSRNDFLQSRTFEKFIGYILTRREEKAIVNRADKLVLLTNVDADRLMQLYGNSLQNKISIVPVCVQKRDKYKYKVPKSSLELLVTGSLWFGANFQGIKWLINNVMPKLDKTHINYHVTIAGSRPNTELKKIANSLKKITLVESPSKMESFFDNADMVLVPVFDGAGMKVKIAEALSYGKPVVATSHALIGYDLTDRFNVYKADTSEEFVKAIIDYSNRTGDEKELFSIEAFQAFEKYYSMDVSIKRWNEILIEKA